MSTRKRITELTVAELRIQLGKRGVDTAGDRPALISKLKKALQEENAKTSASPKTGAAVTGAAAQPAQGDGGSGTSPLLGPQKLKMEKTSDGEEETKTTDSGNNVASVPALVDKDQSTPVAPTSISSGIVLRSSTRIVTEVPGTTCAAPDAIVEPLTTTPATAAVASTLAPVTASSAQPAASLVGAPVAAVSTSEEPSSTTCTPAAAATTTAAAVVDKPQENTPATKEVVAESPVTSSASDANVSQSQTDVVTSVAPSASGGPVASSVVPSEDIMAKTSVPVVSSKGEVPKTTGVVASKNVTTPKAVVLPTVAPTAGLPTVVAKKPVVTPTLSSAGTPKPAAVGARKVVTPVGTGTPAARVATPASTTTPPTSSPASSPGAASVTTTAVNQSPVAAASSPATAVAMIPEAADKVTTSAPDTESKDKDGATPACEVTVVKEEKMDKAVVVGLTAESPMDTTPSSSSTAVPKTSTKPAVTNKTIAQSVMTDGSTAGHSLWVSGLTTSFRAADLKVLFGNHGKVIAAKVVTSAKSPGSKCFGFVLMSSAEEADEAINKLNNTEVQGQKITVEKDRQKRAIVQPSTAAVSAQIPASTTLWVNGLSSTTKAADLKMLFMKHGKVIGAKVVTSAKNPGSKCYGLVTLSTAEEADVCIRNLNKTEFHGKIISLEKAKSDVKTQSKTTPSTGVSPSVSSGGVNKKDGKAESTDKKDDTKQKQNESELTKDDHAKEVKKDDTILSLDKIREERERERRMQRERAARDAERRRLRDLEHERRMQRAEAERLAREREKLRLEKLRLERERMEAERARIQLERERQRREQERERERELERMERQRRETRQASPGYRSELKRPSGTNDGNYWQQAKRPLLDDRPVSSSFTGGYNVHGSSGFYDKAASSQFAAGDRRETARAREPEKTGSSMQSSWTSYRPHDGRTNEPTQRTTTIEQAAFSSTSDWNRGAGVSQWPPTASTYRAADSNYTGFGSSSAVDSSRQYLGSAPASNTSYMGGTTGQSYKWYQ